MDEVETVNRIEIPAFVYRGFRFPKAEVAKEIENTNTHDATNTLQLDSVTLAELRALYELKLEANYDMSNLAGVRKEAVMAAISIFALASGTEEWTTDACDYRIDKKPPRGALVPKDYVPVRWTTHPIFKKSNGVWGALRSKDSREVFTFLPPEGFVIPTLDGFYRHDIGIPFATVKDRNVAVRLLEKASLHGQIEASYFKRADETDKVCAVYRQHCSPYGPFLINVDREPGCIGASPYQNIGIRPIQRLEASGKQEATYLISESDLDDIVTGHGALRKVIAKLKDE
jgi:hypothetical protein